MVFEDEVTEALNMGISATGDLDKSQTRQVMHFDGIFVLKKRCPAKLPDSFST